MPTYVTYTWKEKLDTAFNKQVKVYVAFLVQLERSPNEGQLTLPDDLAKTVSKRLNTHDLGDIEAVKDRVPEANLSGDTKFLNKLGNAMSSNPLKNPAQHGKTYSVLNIFWLHGLNKITSDELHEFLTSCDLIPLNSGHTFQRFVRRHIRSVYEF
jgi:hypothetical protein